ncbi:MAG: hypothetical protein GXY22_07870 [Clostridiaceae bacterium]|nr:hypothetical protein [Clostridiaceae bacterium]
MDIKEKIESVVEKIKKDPSLAKKFKEDPVKTIESLIGIDLPDDQIKKVIDGVKAKLAVDQAGALKDKFKKLF